MNKNQKGNQKGLLIALCIILAVLAFALGGILLYFMFQSDQPQTTKRKETETELVQETEETEETEEEYEETEDVAVESTSNIDEPRIVTHDNGDVVYRSATANLRYDEDTAALYYNDLLTVYLLSELDEDAADALAEMVGGTVVGKLSGAMNMLQILVEPTDLEGLKALADILMESEDVLYASYDYPMELSETADNNPWSADGTVIDGKNNEKKPAGNDWWAEAIRAYTAWDLVDHRALSTVKVGVLDSGVDTDHEDLANNLSPLPGYEENTEEDHGTHVSGIIAAENNNRGIRGIADTAELVYADWSPSNGTNYLNTLEYMIILKKMIEDGVKVANNSWGGTFLSEKGYTRMAYWDEVSYFSEMSDTYIRLKDNAAKNGYDKEYTFRENNINRITFYIDDEEVTVQKFRKKVKSGSLIGLQMEENEVTEVYLIKNEKQYIQRIVNSGTYAEYVREVEIVDNKRAIDCALGMAELLLNKHEDYIIVQAAGNGYDNSGPGVEAKWAGYFCALNEEVYNTLPAETRDKLSGEGISYTDIDDRIMIVGAVKNKKDIKGRYKMTDFSNYGENVDICAPGEDIFSTVASASENYYGKKSGTSMAAPMVTGAAALLWQINSNLDAAEVKSTLLNSTSTLAVGVGSGKGRSYPMLDVGAAVESVSENVRGTDGITRDIVLVLDRSGSMSGEPLEQTKAAAVKFIDTVFERESQVAIVTYDSWANVECELTDNKDELTADVEGIYSGDNTNMYAGLEQADSILQNSQAQRKIIVLMSDGLPNAGVSDGGDYSAPLIRYAEEMKNKGYYVYTLGFFSDVYGYDRTSAQQLLEGIASPGLHYEVNNADDLIFFFDDIANQISGTRYVYIRIACPVDVTVSSGQETLSSKAGEENTRTSFGALTYENSRDETDVEDIFSSYENMYDYLYGSEEETVQDDRVKILRLNMEEDYDVEIEGYGSGKMDYTVSFPNDNGEYDDVREFPNISVTASTKAVSSTSETKATYLKVDENGDGRIDTTYKAEANGKMEEVKDRTLLYLILLVAAIVILLIVILILVLVRVSAKKKKASGGGRNTEPEGAIYGAFGVYSGQSYPMRRGQQCVVGRKSTCDIQLVHGQVSRVHCVIEMLPDGVYQVTDHSSNGTFYNNQKLKSRQPYRLPKGALLAVGDADNVLELR